LDFSHHRCAKCFLSYAFIHRPLLLLLLLLLSLSRKGIIFAAHYQIYLCVLFDTVIFDVLLQGLNSITMFLERIRTLCSKRPGGVKGLAAEVDMSDVNLFRCIREGSIKAQDLERIAKALDVSITEFFPDDKSYLSIGNNAVSSFNGNNIALSSSTDIVKENEELRARIAQLEEHLRDKDLIISLLRRKSEV
jgi:hypothetical protein